MSFSLEFYNRLNHIKLNHNKISCIQQNESINRREFYPFIYDVAKHAESYRKYMLIFCKLSFYKFSDLLFKPRYANFGIAG